MMLAMMIQMMMMMMMMMMMKWLLSSSSPPLQSFPIATRCVTCPWYPRSVLKHTIKNVACIRGVVQVLPYVLGLHDWKEKVRSGTKTMTRRNWVETTLDKWRDLIGRNIYAGKCFGKVKWGVIRIESITLNQSLSDFPSEDVLLEGGRHGQTPQAFVLEHAKYFRDRGTKRIDWEKMYTVIKFKYLYDVD